MAIGALYFAGIRSDSYGCYVTDAEIYNSSDPDFSRIEIPGRNGDLHISNGRMKNVTVNYPAFIAEGFEEKFLAFRSALFEASKRSYMRLEDTFLPGHFRMAKVVSGIAGRTHIHSRDIGKFIISFDCRPELYRKTGERAIELRTNGSIYNPTANSAKPLIRVYGAGTVTVGTGVFTVNTAGTQYIDIDCDTLQAFEGSTYRNGNITVNKWAELTPGLNTVTLGAGVTKVEVIPRWYDL